MVRADSIRKIIDILMYEVAPELNYEKKLQVYEIANNLSKMASGLSNGGNVGLEFDEAFDMIGCYRNYMEKARC